MTKYTHMNNRTEESSSPIDSIDLAEIVIRATDTGEIFSEGSARVVVPTMYTGHKTPTRRDIACFMSREYGSLLHPTRYQYSGVNHSSYTDQLVHSFSAVISSPEKSMINGAWVPSIDPLLKGTFK